MIRNQHALLETSNRRVRQWPVPKLLKLRSVGTIPADEQDEDAMNRHRCIRLPRPNARSAPVLLFDATRSGGTALDTAEEQGNPFASALIEAAAEPELRPRHLARRLRKLTVAKSEGPQYVGCQGNVALPACSLGSPGSRRGSGLTLVEMLVVIAIIGLLAALLLPVLSSARAKASAVTCLNNTRQLTLAWTVYGDANQDRCVNNHGVDQTRTERNTWVNQVLDWGAEPDNTNALLLTEALLGDAVGKSVRTFKCPADRERADNGVRLRSYALNCMVGNPGRLLDEYNRDFRQFLRSADFIRPSAVFLFLDEHPDTINDGFYMIRLGRYEWSNLPASFHHGAANVSFADGHAETHRWLVTGPNGTVRPAVRGAVKGDFPADPPTDYLWVMERMSELKAR